MILYALLGGVLFAGGCDSATRTSQPTPAVCHGTTTKADAMHAAQEVLERMRFPIEKVDIDQGIIRTAPLRAGQFFEPWRADNAGPFNAAEANLQTIRRSVELRASEAGDRVCIECRVSVQRLSLPENEVASLSQAYRMHSRSEPSLQRLELTDRQRRGVAWIDLGRDGPLEAKILKRIQQKLQR